MSDLRFGGRSSARPLVPPQTPVVSHACHKPFSGRRTVSQHVSKLCHGLFSSHRPDSVRILTDALPHTLPLEVDLLMHPEGVYRAFQTLEVLYRLLTSVSMSHVVSWSSVWGPRRSAYQIFHDLRFCVLGLRAPTELLLSGFTKQSFKAQTLLFQGLLFPVLFCLPSGHHGSKIAHAWWTRAVLAVHF